MTGSLTVDTGSTDVVAAALAAAADQLRDPSNLLADVGARVVTDATTRAPRRTGALAGSGKAAAAAVDGRPAVILTWGVRYAVPVNFGTKRMPARPFATDALAAAGADLDKLAATWAEQIIDTI